MANKTMTPQRVERYARALCTADGVDPDSDVHLTHDPIRKEWEFYVPQAQTVAALADAERYERRHEEDGFVCEWDGDDYGSSPSDSFTVSWNNGSQWIVIHRNGTIVAGQSPAGGRRAVSTTWSALTEGDTVRADQRAALPYPLDGGLPTQQHDPSEAKSALTVLARHCGLLPPDAEPESRS